ncbi:hypothetical protein [Pseudophaeobacter sp.]|uniref:hypothetical protein n=1 Tax=Pseudophaeobacter sp. TaxID=1971739 RepID=UPI003298A01A
MTKADDTIRILIPLKVRKNNGRPKILPPADYRPSEDQTQDPHILRAGGVGGHSFRSVFSGRGDLAGAG